MSEPAGIEREQAWHDVVSLTVLVADLCEAGQPDTARDLVRRRLRRTFEAGRLQGRREIQTDGKLGPNPWERSGWLEAEPLSDRENGPAAS